MTKVSETDAIKALDDALGGLDDPAARDRVLRWAWEKYSTKPFPQPEDDELQNNSDATKAKKKATAKTPASSKVAKTKTSLSIVKDLNLKPKGRKSFDDFVSEKKPKSNQQKCTLSVYYLRHELELPKVSSPHVFTCFKHMKWRVPADLANTLQYTASKDGWLDTKKMDDIKVTTIGENVVEHDLPPGKPKK
jgi:hypothetical protein